MRLAFGGGLWPILILPIAMLSPWLGALAATDGPRPQFEILKYDLAANQDTPELCVLFSESVARSPAMPLESFVTVDPAATLSATPRKDRLCLTGFSFGHGYMLSLKAGLPGVSGALLKDGHFRVEIPNRPPEFAFATPAGDIVPRIGSQGLPIRSVNMPKIDLHIFRISDENLLSVQSRPLLTVAGAAAFAPAHGERVWDGSLGIKGEANRDAITEVPIEQTIGSLKPGLYVATLAAPGAQPADQLLPTQYFTVSDLGLSLFRGPTSVLVAARSLSTAAAAPGIDIAMLAANNREIARVRTDGNGLARFDTAPQGAAGDRPAAIFAYGPAGEFATLGLGADPVADAPQDVPAALIHADRAIYRPGETVNILALLRNAQGSAVSKLPLTLDVIQPSGAILSSDMLSDQGAGAYNLAVALPNVGSDGVWRIEARTDPAGKPVGSATFEVGLPPTRLSLGLNADVAVIDPLQPANISIQAQYPEGQAALIPGELHIGVGAAANPFPAFPGFSFGLADETVAPLAQDPIRFVTDATGKTSIPVKIAASFKSTRPLEAEIAVRLFDSNGRVVEHTVSVPVGTQAYLLGVKPQLTILPNQSAHFEVIAVSPDGARQEKAGAGWEILREDVVPSWYWDGHRFAYRPAVRDNHVAGGMVDIPAGAPAMLDASLPTGRYRIEVFDPNGEAISSARFTVGWAPRNDGDPIDAVAIGSSKGSFTAGDAAELFVQPPFDADILVTSADPRIRETVVQHVPAAGAVLRLPVSRDAGLGMQLYAAAFGPPDPAAPGLTRRAFGQATLLSDPSPRSLAVTLDLPAIVMPQRTLSVPVTVAGAGDEPVYVRVSAVDARPEADRLEHDALLDPLVGRQLTTVSVRDNYDNIITASGLANGALNATPAPDLLRRSGSDSHRPAPIPLALYSGIVTLDKSGKGNVLLVLPDFAGTMKVKALAWSASRSGQAEAEVAVRYPLETTLLMPAYLRSDDRADLMLQLDNADGSRGEYHVSVKGDGAIAVQGEADSVFNLAEHEQRGQPVSVLARGTGEGAIIVAVKGPGGIAFERHLPLPVRSAGTTLTRHATAIVKAAGALALDPAVTAGLRPDSLTFSLIAGGGDVDFAGLIDELKGSDRASAERIIDGAAADLMTAAASPTAAAGNEARAGLTTAAQFVAAYQGGDGGFSLFGAGASDPWLTAYVGDFLTQAKRRGAAIPEVLRRQTFDYLAHQFDAAVDAAPGAPDVDPAGPDYPQSQLAAAAYAARVLAANDRLTLFQLRYFNDRFQSRLRNPVAAALVAAAFADLGDKAAATAAFARAGSLPIDPALSALFGSDLRDQAILTALMAESGAVAQPSVAANVAKLGAIAAGQRQFNPQEAAWIVRASAGQPASAMAIKLKVGDKSVSQNGPFTMTGVGPSLPAIKNGGEAPIRISVTVTGAPVPTEGRDLGGYEVQRWFFDTSGKAIDPGAMRQGDRAVVVLTGRFAGSGEAHPLLSDSLPAGWAIEATEITDALGRYPWLKDLSGASHAAIIDGRYVAVPRLSADKREFKLAYVVRATTCGQFAVPGTSIEDMGQPVVSARLPGGRTKVEPAS